MKKKRSRDVNEMAFDIVSQATESVSEAVSAAAKALSKLGASKGGIARAKKLTESQRKIIALNAAKARWHKKR